jgi:hypothetical protein
VECIVLKAAWHWGVLLLLLLFIMRSSDPYKARSPLDIELVNG